MKKILVTFILCFTCLASLMAQIPDIKDIKFEQMVIPRAPTQGEVTLDIIRLAPVLYKSDKTDSILLLVDYYERNFDQSSMLVPLKFLLSIKQRNFKETLKVYGPGYPAHADSASYKSFILFFLENFNKMCACLAQPDCYSERTRELLIPYFSFVGHVADELKSIPDLAAAEKFLVTFYANPTNSTLLDAADTAYNGTLVQRQWLRLHPELKMKPKKWRKWRSQHSAV